MAYKISWTNIAFEDYQQVIEYLISEWSLTVAANFESIVNKKLANISRQPFIGIASQKNRLVRSILLTKHNSKTLKRIFFKDHLAELQFLERFCLGI